MRGEIDRLEDWGVAGAAKAAALNDACLAVQFLKKSYTGLQQLQKDLGNRGRLIAQSENRPDIAADFAKAAKPHTRTVHEENMEMLDAFSMAPGITGDVASVAKSILDFKDGHIAAGFEDALGAIPFEKVLGKSAKELNDLTKGAKGARKGVLEFAGETSSTAAGRLAHKEWADAARKKGNFDLVDEFTTDAAGDPIKVPRRVDLKTGKPKPGARQQRVKPDAVDFDQDLIVVESNLSELKDPNEGEPLGSNWQELVQPPESNRADLELQLWGDLALTKYYDPAQDDGLSTEWEDLEDGLKEAGVDASRIVLGRQLQVDGRVFDPGLQGAYSFPPTMSAMHSMRSNRQISRTMSLPSNGATS